jgi:hypothetical protein
LQSVTVVVRCGLGPTLIAGVASGYAVSLAWSADGSQLAWTAVNGSSVTVVKFTAGKVAASRHWACSGALGCRGIAFLGERAMSTDEPIASQFPELLVYPASGTGAPTTVPMTGLPPYGSRSLAEFNGLGSTPSGLVIEWGHRSVGNTFLVQPYHVDSAGHATAYGTTEFDGIYDVSSSPAGNQFAFGSALTCGNGTGQRQTVDLMNTATGTISRPAFPAGQPGYLVTGTWFDPSGTPYVSLAPATAACTTQGAGTWQAGVAPVVCKLVNDTWVSTGSGVFYASYGPGHWLAEETGVMGTDGPQPTFTISNGASRTTVARVTGFAWAP